MIKVSRLTKYYGDYAAVRNVSFEVPKGQVVGFLGPNGAGKSTTMRILAGYLTATSGRASIDGCDVFWRPRVQRTEPGSEHTPVSGGGPWVTSVGLLTTCGHQRTVAAHKTHSDLNWVGEQKSAAPNSLKRWCARADLNGRPFAPESKGGCYFPIISIHCRRLSPLISALSPSIG